MPDKQKYIEEMMRVLKPGGKFVMATWCQRDDRAVPFTKKVSDQGETLRGAVGTELISLFAPRFAHCMGPPLQDQKDLKFLYEEWTHPYFISIESYAELIEGTGVMEKVRTADWVRETIASWRHSVWVGVYDPRGFIFKVRFSLVE